MGSRLLAVVLGCLLLAPFAPAALADQPATAASVEQVQRPLLWKVEGRGTSMYLLGSFHLLKGTDYPLPAEIDRAFDDSGALLFEVPPEAMDAPETAALMQKYATFDDGTTLESVLPKATVDKLATLLASSGASLKTVQQTKPWAMNLGLVLGVTQMLGFRPELGLDRVLMQRAAAAGKPTGGLETIEDQLEAMDAVPTAEQVAGLDEFLDKPMKVATQLQELHAAWRGGELARLDNEMRADMQRKTPESYRLLNVTRNRAWLPQLERRLADPGSGTTLVVVGALHLLGSDGLIEQLRARGHRVERICETCSVE